MLYLEDDVKIVQGFLEKGKSGLTLVIDFLHPFSFQEHLKTIMDHDVSVHMDPQFFNVLRNRKGHLPILFLCPTPSWTGTDLGIVRNRPKGSNR